MPPARLGRLDLCWVAPGVVDGFWEQYLKPWDTAAGILLVQEAGGKVSILPVIPIILKKNKYWPQMREFIKKWSGFYPSESARLEALLFLIFFYMDKC